MRISKTQDVNLSVSASWKVEKFSLLKLFKIIENEYTTLIPMTKDYRSVIVVCRGICDEVKYTFDEFKKTFFRQHRIQFHNFSLQQQHRRECLLLSIH